jgi:hypothetical protein
MSCLCGHNESCNICNPCCRITELERTLQEIDQTIDEAMGEPLVGARALISMRWARKLIAKALGKDV